MAANTALINKYLATRKTGAGDSKKMQELLNAAAFLLQRTKEWIYNIDDDDDDDNNNNNNNNNNLFFIITNLLASTVEM